MTTSSTIRRRVAAITLIASCCCLFILLHNICMVSNASFAPQEIRSITQRFQQYLQVPTQHPNPKYDLAIDFLIHYIETNYVKSSTSQKTKPTIIGGDFKISHHVNKYISQVGENERFKYQVFSCDGTTPNFILTVKGKYPKEGSVLVSSHMDVVPADEEKWSYPPFNATVVDVLDDHQNVIDRRIYSRGSQDMKCVGSAYLEAVNQLLKANDNWQPERNLHIAFTADEEIGGRKGWGCLLSPELVALWTELNVRFGLDEGIASGLNDDTVQVFYGEKANWWFEITIPGNVGHGSQFIKDTSTEKLHRLLKDKIFPFREHQELQMKLSTTNPRKKKSSSSVITINLTGIRAGHTDPRTGEFSNPNVIPRTTVALFDMRLYPGADTTEVDHLIRNDWAAYVNGSVKFIHQIMDNPLTDLNDPFVKKFESIVNERMNTDFVIVPAGTDARYPRSKGVNVLGYSYMPRTKVLLHDNDEYIDESVYVESVVNYMHIFERLLTKDE
ncbi:hypothetical protein C9374_007808 [Naegleria lovaniensis]|uniref:Peptidase M20 dimerisation domain-containing protein n=1 Tax=Naegleria lovaniensis TaxID=51637 RepID=A0AA88GLP5_NAELO|nr:uncharacterized protein C9374_007808 [Naegleria lovaniensis]KAG2379170.1 hypothetical protein C9374_007808 [Naegleria lovaniensis]